MNRTGFAMLLVRSLTTLVVVVCTALTHTVHAVDDVFETDPATTYQDLALPSDYFAPYCDQGFTGRVYLRGEPFDCWGSHCDLYPADMMIRRLQPSPPPATIPIEIVGMELRSVSPITVNCTSGPQTWNLAVSVPLPDFANQFVGSMTYDHAYPNGGTFTWSLPIAPLMTFTRVSDNAKVGPRRAPSSTFTASGPWCNTANPLDAPPGEYVVTFDPGVDFFPGVICSDSPGGAGLRKKTVIQSQAGDAAHGVLLAAKKNRNECYDIQGPPLNQFVTISNRFGTVQVTVMEPRYVCPSALTDQSGDLQAPHIECYNIAGSNPNTVVDLRTQFGTEPNVDVGQARFLCMPVTVEVLFPQHEPAPALLPANPSYTCYEIAAPPPGAAVDLQTRFSADPGLPVGPAGFYCSPTIVNYEANNRQPDLECYNILGTDPPHVVNLHTRLDDGSNVSVGPSKLTCVPAKTTVASDIPSLTTVGVGIGVALLVLSMLLLWRPGLPSPSPPS